MIIINWFLKRRKVVTWEALAEVGWGNDYNDFTALSKSVYDDEDYY